MVGTNSSLPETFLDGKRPSSKRPASPAGLFFCATRRWNIAKV